MTDWIIMGIVFALIIYLGVNVMRQYAKRNQSKETSFWKSFWNTLLSNHHE